MPEAEAYAPTCPSSWWPTKTCAATICPPHRAGPQAGTSASDVPRAMAVRISSLRLPRSARPRLRKACAGLRDATRAALQKRTASRNGMASTAAGCYGNAPVAPACRRAPPPGQSLHEPGEGDCVSKAPHKHYCLASAVCWRLACARIGGHRAPPSQCLCVQLCCTGPNSP